MFHCYKFQKRHRSFVALTPLLREGFLSLILSDSLNAKIRQLSDLPIIFVLSRTVLIWSCLSSTISASHWSRPLMCANPSHSLKCLYTALSFCFQACWFVRLKRVDSVFPIYLSEQPGHVYSYTIPELLSSGIMSLFVDLRERSFILVPGGLGRIYN